jgi:Ca2+-binding RTX toxin-like protein
MAKFNFTGSAIDFTRNSYEETGAAIDAIDALDNIYSYSITKNTSSKVNVRGYLYDGQRFFASLNLSKRSNYSFTAKKLRLSLYSGNNLLVNYTLQGNINFNSMGITGGKITKETLSTNNDSLSYKGNYDIVKASRYSNNNNYGGLHAYITRGNDLFNGTNNQDNIEAGAGNDTVNGKNGSDTIYGQNGKDKLNGQDGDDYLDGGNDNDILNGGTGNDELHGGTGKDFLRGGEGEDTLYGDGGNDKLMGEGGEDILYGGTGKDFLRGGEGEDTLYGESGNDKLKAGDGNDILVGGLGKDNLYGGSGNDVFKLTEGIGYDRIRDFKKGEDRVDIADYDINELGVFDSGKNIKVYLDENKSDLLAIIYKNNIDDGSISDFIF